MSKNNAVGPDIWQTLAAGAAGLLTVALVVLFLWLELNSPTGYWTACGYPVFDQPEWALLFKGALPLVLGWAYEKFLPAWPAQKQPWLLLAVLSGFYLPVGLNYLQPYSQMAYDYRALGFLPVVTFILYAAASKLGARWLEPRGQAAA